MLAPGERIILYVVKILAKGLGNAIWILNIVTSEKRQKEFGGGKMPAFCCLCGIVFS